MEALPDNLELDDVWQWLNSGWFLYDLGDDLVPAQLVRNDPEYDEAADLYEVMSVDQRTREFVREKCIPHWPVCGAVNLDGCAVIAERSQTRQYRRTYNSRCVELNIPRKWDVMKRFPEARNLTADHRNVVRALFSPDYPSYSKALSLLGSTHVSVALSPYLVIAGVEEEQLVYYRGKLLARVEEDRLLPLNPSNPRNRRVLKWFEGRVRYENTRSSA